MKHQTPRLTPFEKSTTPFDNGFLFLFGSLGLLGFSLLFALAFRSTGLDQTALSVVVQVLSTAALALGMIGYLFVKSRPALWVIGRGFCHWPSLLFGFAIFLGCFLLSFFYSLAIDAVAPWAGDSNANQDALNAMLLKYPAPAFLASVIFAPFYEELCYRGGLTSWIGRYHRVLGIVVGAFVFALMHFDFSSFQSAFQGQPLSLYRELILLPNYLLLAFGLGLSYVLTDNLSASILCHVLNNLYTFVAVYLTLGR